MLSMFPSRNRACLQSVSILSLTTDIVTTFMSLILLYTYSRSATSVGKTELSTHPFDVPADGPSHSQDAQRLALLGLDFQV